MGAITGLHHITLVASNAHTQLEFREKLMDAGLRVSPVRDRVYFKSIYTNDPDGHIVELATEGPGFLYDEIEAELGQGLMLPPWLEDQRDQIEHILTPVTVNPWRIPQEA